MRCAPQSIYTIGRHIPDPSDLNTYYVRAYVFDARTFTLLETLNLEDKGNGTHTKEYRLPSDPSGSGRQLLVKTTVFTDSGFTTKSPLYAEELDTELLVITETKTGGGGGSGYSTDIDYTKISKLVNEALTPIKKELAQEIKDNKSEKVDLSSLKDTLLEALGGVLLAVKDIKAPDIKETDLTPVLDKIDTIKKAIKDIPDYGKDILKVAQTGIKILSRQDLLETKIGKISLPEVITREVEKEVLDEQEEKLKSVRNLLNE